MSDQPGLAGIEAARDLVRAVTVETPLMPSRWLSRAAGAPVWLKAENLQRTGSFKIRGASVRMARMSQAERRAGVVAASAGNHAQGVALAARELGIPAVIFMPNGAPLPKEQATRSYGAQVLFAGATVDEALVRAAAYARETGAVLVHPFDHVDVIEGQGTLGLEILEQLPEVGSIVAAVGGGGLVAGIATAVKAVRPDVQVVGVQAGGAAAYPDSLAAGSPVTLSKLATVADGIAVARPGDLPFSLIQALCDDVVTVSEESISRALLMLIERSKLIVEPAGAAAVAAVMDGVAGLRPPVVAVLSGGNVDPQLLNKVIRRGLTAAGRYLAVRVRLTDHPGGLARLLVALAEEDANVIEIVHERTTPGLQLDEAGVSLQLETRGPAHADRVLARLGQSGYAVTV